MGTNERAHKRERTQWIVLLCLAVGAIAAIWWFKEWAYSAPTVQVTFVHPDQSRSSPVALEIAVTASERQRGLMFRSAAELPANGGMIFIFPQEKEQRFHMRDTKLSLDMIFLDKKMSVVGILRDVPILNDEIRSIDKPSQYVIELHAGKSKQLNIQTGSVAQVAGVLPRATS